MLLDRGTRLLTLAADLVEDGRPAIDCLFGDLVPVMDAELLPPDQKRQAMGEQCDDLQKKIDRYKRFLKSAIDPLLTENRLKAALAELEERNPDCARSASRASSTPRSSAARRKFSSSAVTPRISLPKDDLGTYRLQQQAQQSAR